MSHPPTELAKPTRRSTPRARRLLALLASLASSLACATSHHDADDPRRLRVEFGACAAVLEGPVCALSETWGPRLWVEAPPTATTKVDVDGVEITPDKTIEVQGGITYFLPTLGDAKRLTVTTSDGEATSSWQLQLDASPPRAWRRALDPLIEAQDNQAIVDHLRAALATEPEDQRGLILSLLLRVDLDLDVQDQESLLLQTIDTHREHQRLTAWVNDSTMLTWLYLRNDWRIAEARALLEGLVAPSDAKPSDDASSIDTPSDAKASSSIETAWPPAHWPVEATYYVAYYRGLLADATGDARQAVLWLRRAAQQAQRVDFERWHLLASQTLAQSLRHAGQHAAAAERLATIETHAESVLPACERAQIANTIAWDQLLARELGQPVGDPTSRIENALALFRESDCPDAVAAGNMLINLALARLQNDDPEQARHLLNEARRNATDPPLNHLVWWQDIAARIALRQQDAKRALAFYEELEALALSADSADARWRAAFGRARSLEALGQTSRALEAYANAEDRLDEASLRVPIHLDRAQFAAPREPATRRFLALLLQEGKSADALDVVRRARVRGLRSLALERRLARLDTERRGAWDEWTARYRALRESIDQAAAEDWRLPADQRQRALDARAAQRQALRDLMDQAFTLVDGTPNESIPLPERKDGELVLAYHPLPDGWVALALDDRGVRYERLPALQAHLSPSALAHQLLVPFEEAISRTRSIRVLPYGPLRQIDFHALPFGTGLLIDAAPVIYGLDLPSRTAEPTAPRRAIVVADPNDNLPLALQEADVVSAALESAGWAVQVLRGAEATTQRVRAALDGASLLHFAGHGAFAVDGPWDSALPLAGGNGFTVGDVLALPTTPERVMLLACESGRSDPHAPGESALGLAQAFLVAGSTRVLASLRPVGDDEAAIVARAFYAGILKGHDDAHALRQAQTTLRERFPESDWASFRLLAR